MDWSSLISQGISSFIATGTVGSVLFVFMLTRLDKAEATLSRRHDESVERTVVQLRDIRESINLQAHNTSVLTERVGVQNGRVGKAEARLDEIDDRERELLSDPPYYRKDEMLELLTHNLRAAVVDAMTSLDNLKRERSGDRG